MPVLTIQPSGKTFDFAPGVILLAALKEAGETLATKCDGKATCGGCHIYIQDGRKSVSKTTRQENEKLDSIVGVSSKSRLACQVTLGEENVTVELLGFSSGF